MSHKFSDFFLHKLKKNGPKKNVFLCCIFWSDWNLDTFSTSKWTSKPKFCERYPCSWQKKWPEMTVKLPNAKVVTFECEQTILAWFFFLLYFSGTSMHPVEATLYYSAGVLPALLGFHPVLALGCIADCAFGAWLGHDGFQVWKCGIFVVQWISLPASF